MLVGHWDMPLKGTAKHNAKNAVSDNLTSCDNLTELEEVYMLRENRADWENRANCAIFPV